MKEKESAAHEGTLKDSVLKQSAAIESKPIESATAALGVTGLLV